MEHDREKTDSPLERGGFVFLPAFFRPSGAFLFERRRGEIVRAEKRFFRDTTGRTV